MRYRAEKLWESYQKPVYERHSKVEYNGVSEKVRMTA